MSEMLMRTLAALLVPLCKASVQVVTLILSNLAFYKIVHDHLLNPLYFTPIAFCFGLSHLLFFSSLDLVGFYLFTAIFFSAFLHVATLLNDLLQYKCTTTLNVLVFCYAMGCFRIWPGKEEGDFDEYLMAFAVMTVKLLCAGKEVQKLSLEEKNSEHAVRTQTLNLVSYLIFTAWIPYKDFLNLQRRRRQQKKGWWRMIVSGALRAILYKVAASGLVHDGIVEDFCLKEQLFWMIKAFQLRCKYYHRAYLGELEVTATGVKKSNWTRHYMCNVKRIESSIIFKEVLIGLNKPLTAFIRTTYTTKSRSGVMVILNHLAMFISLLSTYHVKIAYAWFWFLISVYTQEKVFRYLEDYEICLLRCTARICFHKYGRRTTLFYAIKYVSIIVNHFRLSLLYVCLSSVQVPLYYIILAVLFDLTAIVVLKLNRMPKYRYFELLMSRI